MKITDISKKLMTLSSPRDVSAIHVVYSTLMLSILNMSQPELLKALAKDKEDEDSYLALNASLQELAQKHGLDKPRYFNSRYKPLILELVALIAPYHGQEEYVSETIRELIENNPKKLGFSFTPKALRTLILELVEIYDNKAGFKSFYDPNARLGDLIDSYIIQRNSNVVYLEESTPLTQQLGSMLLMLNFGQSRLNFLCRNVLMTSYLDEKDIKVDCVMSYPRLSYTPNDEETDTPKDYLVVEAKATHKTKSVESLIVQLATSRLTDHGYGFIVVSDGFLNKHGYDAEVRRFLIDGDFVEGVIALPNDIYSGVTLSTSLLILRNQNAPGLVKMVDLSQKDLATSELGYVYDFFGKQALAEEPNLCFKTISTTDIIEKNYSLKPIDYLQTDEKNDYIAPKLSDELLKLKQLRSQFNVDYEKWNDILNGL